MPNILEKEANNKGTFYALKKGERREEERKKMSKCMVNMRAIQRIMMIVLTTTVIKKRENLTKQVEDLKYENS